MAAQTLNAIHESQPAARKLFDWILQAGLEDNRTTVEGLMESCDVSRRQAITVLRSLADAGYGEFKVGRKGHPSRLEWAEDPRALARQLQSGEPITTEDEPNEQPDDPQDEALEPIEPPPEHGGPPASGELFPDMFAERPRPRRRPPGRDPELIQHSYVLRPKLRIVVELPEDLSAREAEVLGEWLRNLSFER